MTITTTLSEEIINMTDEAKGSKSKATLPLLLNGTKKFEAKHGGGRLDNAKGVKFTMISPVVYKQMRSLRILGDTANDWGTAIIFQDIDFKDEKSDEYNVAITDKSGEIYYIKPIHASSTNVNVRCSCPDFTYTFAWYVKEQLNALAYGKLKKYKRKTTTRPPRNPHNIAGACKHIIALTNALSQAQATQSKILV